MGKKLKSAFKKLVRAGKTVFEYFYDALNGYRKWSLVAGVLMLGSAFLMQGLVTGAEWVDLAKGVVIAFVAGNGIEHTMNAAAEWAKKRISRK